MTDPALPTGSCSAVDVAALQGALTGFPWVFHVAPRERLAAIFAGGLRPGTASVDFGTLSARPNCVYFGAGDLVTGGWLHEWTDRHTASTTGPGDDLLLSLDVTVVDARRILPDEDAFMEQEELAGFDVEPWDETSGLTFGQWAEHVALGSQPGLTEHAIARRETLAIRGAIRPQDLRAYTISGYRLVDLGPLTQWATPAALAAALDAADLDAQWADEQDSEATPVTRPEHWAPAGWTTAG